MTTKTLDSCVGIDVDRIVVDGMSLKDLNPSILTPEEVRNRAGLSTGMYEGERKLYSHNHCQYQRCT